MSDKYIPWENIKKGMEVLYVGPGADSGFIGEVTIKYLFTGYAVLCGLSNKDITTGVKNDLYIADAKEHLYDPDSSLDEVNALWLRKDTRVYSSNGKEYLIESLTLNKDRTITSLYLCCPDAGSFFATCYPELYYFKPPRRALESPKSEKVVDPGYNGFCPVCGAPAYLGLNRLECSKGC